MREAFRERTEAYLAKVKAFYSEGTLTRIRANLEVIRRDLMNLNIPKAVGVAPTRLHEEHIAGLLLVWRGRGLQPATIERYVGDLNGLLTWCGNPIIEQMRKTKYVRFPKRDSDAPISTVSDEELDRLRAVAEGTEGWRGSVARFLVGFLPYTGLRPKEVRLANLVDLDVAKGRIKVSHPKGEGAWKSGEHEAPLPPAAREALADFLTERTEYLAGESCESLIPYRMAACGSSGEWDAEVLGPWPSSALRKLKADLQERSGVRFRGWKAMRATFGQRAVNAGVPIEKVSRAMRHKYTQTTERFYARVSAGVALDAVNRAFDKPAIRHRPR